MKSRSEKSSKNNRAGKHPFANLLKEARTRAGLTQKEVARWIGYHPQFISNVERGRCLLPYEKLPLLVALLPVTENEIIRAILEVEYERIKAQFRKASKSAQSSPR